MIWAITSYFNPANYQQRKINYHRFRQALPLQLLTVELSFNGVHEIQGDDVIHITTGDVMWQKERLLNIALENLPAACDKVLWIDSDVLVDDKLPDMLDDCLDSFPVVQPFSTVELLNADGGILFSQSSLASIADRDVFSQLTLRQQSSPTAGFMWAARRDFLQRHGFYDACVIGGGDTAFACAAYGKFEHVMRLHSMNRWQRQYYSSWARKVHQDIRGNVGCLDLTIQHMWHGSMKDRNSRGRHEGFAAFSFNPYVDIRAEKAWRWNTNKSEMHEYVQSYFRSRNEDSLEPSQTLGIEEEAAAWLPR